MHNATINLTIQSMYTMRDIKISNAKYKIGDEVHLLQQSNPHIRQLINKPISTTISDIKIDVINTAGGIEVKHVYFVKINGVNTNISTFIVINSCIKYLMENTLY